MEKHWTVYLPEAGRIKRKGEDILYLHRLLGQAKAEVQQLTRKIAELEDEAFQMARTWSIEEITEAKQKPNRRLNNEKFNCQGLFAPFLLRINPFSSKAIK